MERSSSDFTAANLEPAWTDASEESLGPSASFIFDLSTSNLEIANRTATLRDSGDTILNLAAERVISTDPARWRGSGEISFLAPSAPPATKTSAGRLGMTKEVVNRAMPCGGVPGARWYSLPTCGIFWLCASITLS